MNGKIYAIRNTINGKVYIGQTIQTVEARFKQHKKLCKSNKNQLIYKAMIKYGKENFVVEEIMCGIESYAELNRAEAEYIARYDSLAPKGYNTSPGGALWRRRPALTENEQIEIVRMYMESGMSQRAIAELYGVSHNAIGDVLRRKEVVARERQCNLPDRTSVVTKEDMHELYVVKGMMIKDIAAQYGVNVRTINRAKNRFGLKRI